MDDAGIGHCGRSPDRRGFSVRRRGAAYTTDRFQFYGYPNAIGGNRAFSNDVAELDRAFWRRAIAAENIAGYTASKIAARPNHGLERSDAERDRATLYR